MTLTTGQLTIGVLLMVYMLLVILVYRTARKDLKQYQERLEKIAERNAVKAVAKRGGLHGMTWDVPDEALYLPYETGDEVWVDFIETLADENNHDWEYDNKSVWEDSGSDITNDERYW